MNEGVKENFPGDRLGWGPVRGKETEFEAGRAERLVREPDPQKQEILMRVWSLDSCSPSALPSLLFTERKGHQVWTSPCLPPYLIREVLPLCLSLSPKP